MRIARKKPAVLLIVLPLFAPALYADAEPLKCDTGSILKTFGETEWHVSSCEDSTSFVVVSAAGNPASPFFFISSIKDGERMLYGEGNGSKDASGAALKELEVLINSEEWVRELIALTVESEDTSHVNSGDKSE